MFIKVRRYRSTHYHTHSTQVRLIHTSFSLSCMHHSKAQLQSIVLMRGRAKLQKVLDTETYTCIGRGGTEAAWLKYSCNMENTVSGLTSDNYRVVKLSKFFTLNIIAYSDLQTCVCNKSNIIILSLLETYTT